MGRQRVLIRFHAWKRYGIHVWNSMEPYGSMHGIAWNQMIPCMESHGTIWFHAWKRMEVMDDMVPCMEWHGNAQTIWFHAWNRIEA